MNHHMHKFRFNSEMTGGHDHGMCGSVTSAVGFNNFHIHYFSGVSNYRNHTHYFAGFTGFPIKTENGHIHKMEGLLETNNNHVHKYNGETYEEIQYISGKLCKQARA